MRLNDRSRPQDTTKSSRPIVVPCKLADCIFYEGALKRDPTKCHCSHPQKMDYMTESACPLYKLDWQKRMRDIPGGG